METENKSFLEKLNSKWVTPLFAILAIIYGFFFKINSDQIDQNTKNLKNLQTQMDNELHKKEFENNLKLTIYKEVKDAIEQRDSSLQKATLIVVNEMLKEDTIFREKLKTVLFSTTNSKKLIAVQQKIDQFAVEQTTTTVNGFKIDVFYLDDIIGEAKPIAEQIVSLLHVKYPNYIIRLRLLPKEINAQDGYRIDANQIRFESSERVIANEVLKIIGDKKIFIKEQPQLIMTNYRTPNYISVFVRNM